MLKCQKKEWPKIDGKKFATIFFIEWGCGGAGVVAGRGWGGWVEQPFYAMQRRL